MKRFYLVKKGKGKYWFYESKPVKNQRHLEELEEERTIFFDSKSEADREAMRLTKLKRRK